MLNNHGRDAGPAGEVQSQDTLRRAGLHPVTATPTVRVVRGQRVALLAWLDDGAVPLP
ncbi:hypothetical protein [Deinococcus aquaticus]|uniref:hypothetical protein n=1 Tax=Deinococcus aquaticus TaxID=328692 RepID=UPI00361B15B2